MLKIKREVGLCSFNGTPMRYQAVIPIVVLPLLPLITTGVVVVDVSWTSSPSVATKHALLG